MIKYSAPPFTVILRWLKDGKWYKRKFEKYREAVAWAEQNLYAETIQVKIIGELILEK